jgi:coenzyme F420 hydrogenase subunit beta
MKISEFLKKSIYSEASGVSSYLDENIRMDLNEFGCYEEVFLNTSINQINESINSVVPNFNSLINENIVSKELFGTLKGINYDNDIGYYLNLYGGFVLEGDFRKNGSSGGMTTWILKELFERKLITGVIHVKKVNNLESPVIFEYGISNSLEEILSNAKSRYYPVELSKCLKVVKNNPGNYAIVGIPSFIMAIKLLSKSDDIIKNRIKFTVGLIAGHQKSSKMADVFGWQVGIKPGSLKDIDFRYKGNENLASSYSVKMTGIVNGDKKTIIKPIDELFGDNWRDGYFKINASDYTDDVFNETADVTLGDAWIYPFNLDKNGNNIVITRNSKIDEIITNGIQNNKIKLDKLPKNLIKESQASHLRHTKYELPYRLYKKDKFRQWRPKKRVDASKRINFFRRKIQDLREDISKKSHIIYKEAVTRNDLNYFISRMKKLSSRNKKYYKIQNLISIALRLLNRINILGVLIKKKV